MPLQKIEYAGYEVVYSVPAPYGNGRVEVLSLPNMGTYEWRWFSSDPAAADVIAQSENEGYGIPEIALRDALIACSTSYSAVEEIYQHIPGLVYTKGLVEK